MANSHPGSYCGQDAYNDMLVTERENELRTSSIRSVQRIGTGIESETTRLQGCNRPDSEWGGYEMEHHNDMETVVRRLTPLECERLQGLPDNWTLIGEPEVNQKTGETEYFYVDEDGKRKKVSDSARYKALGNSICTPFWFWLLRRISAQYERPATLGSLFDGIGGFPYCWERSNGEGTAVWASEIEPFCIAVTKEHFPEQEGEPHETGAAHFTVAEGQSDD